MRWWRRGGAGGKADATPGGATDAVGEMGEIGVGATVVGDAAGRDAGDRRSETANAWQRLGQLQPTAAPVAPILAPMGLPELATTRSLIQRPRPVPDEPPLGTVSGIASVLPAPIDDAPSGQGRGADGDSGPSSRVPVLESASPIVRPEAAPTPLTHAIQPYVGEAREPAVPHRAPGWLRAAMPSGDGGISTPLDAFALPAQSWSAPTLPQPQPAEQPLVARRSRRPGLGAPLQPDEIRALRQRAAEPSEPEVTVGDVPVPAPEGPRAVVQPRSSATATSSQAAPSRFTATVPASLAATFQRAHGVDVADVRVDRGPEASAEARRIGARAFTRGDLIVLPPEEGPEDAGAGLALLGHELTHVIQQSLLGGAPPETGDYGRDLEAAAQATEAWIRAGAAGPPPSILPEPPTPLWHEPAPAYSAAGSAAEFAAGLAGSGGFTTTGGHGSGGSDGLTAAGGLGTAGSAGAGGHGPGGPAGFAGTGGLAGSGGSGAGGLSGGGPAGRGRPGAGGPARAGGSAGLAGHGGHGSSGLASVGGHAGAGGPAGRAGFGSPGSGGFAGSSAGPLTGRSTGPAGGFRAGLSSAPSSVSGLVQRAPAGAVDAPRPTVTATPTAFDQDPPELVHPAATSNSAPSSSTFPRTEDELNRAIASGALDVYLRQQSGQAPPAPAAAPVYDREQRRIELTVTLLDRANSQRAERGEQPLTELPAELADMVETRLDGEQAASVPSAGPGPTTGPAGSPNETSSARPARPGGTGAPSVAAPGFSASPQSAQQTGGPAPGFGSSFAATSETTAAPTAPTSAPESAAPAASPTETTAGPPEPQAHPFAAGAADLPDLNEEQVARLYERIKTRLRRELLVDRERTGRLMDFR